MNDHRLSIAPNDRPRRLSEVAHMLDMNVESVRRAVARGELKAVQPGRLVAGADERDPPAAGTVGGRSVMSTKSSAARSGQERRGHHELEGVFHARWYSA